MYFESRELGGARRVASQPIANIAICPEPCCWRSYKKRPVFGRLLSLSATYVQGSARAAVGEWRDKVGYSKVTSVSLEHAVR